MAVETRGKMQLLLIRHAEAEDGGAKVPDHDRHLTCRGLLQARQLGGWIRENSEVWPQEILVSSALRAQQTLENMQECWTARTRFRSSQALYLAGYDQVMSELASHASEAIRCILLLGHNPGWSEIASLLTQQPYSLRPADAVHLQYIGDQRDWINAFSDVGAWRCMSRFQSNDSVMM